MYHKDFIYSYVVTVSFMSRNIKTPLLLAEMLIAILVTSIGSLSDHVVYAHTFSENENALFLTLAHQIKAQIALAKNNFPTNPELAEQNANNAIDLLKQNDPVVNLTWTSQISESNPRIAAQLTSALNSLKNATSINQSKSASITSDMTPANDIKAKVDMINDILGEAVSSRLTKEQLNYSTIQALVIANLANEVYFSYGRAIGESPSTMSNMAGMAMSVKEASSSSSMSMGADMNMSNNNGTGMSSSMAMSTGTNSSSSSNSIKKVTEYQTAQALAGIAKDVFNKNLKTVSSSTLKAANTEIENDLNQLNAAIDNKAPFMDIMKIVHIQLHPTFITAYHLQLKSFQ